MVSPAGTPAVWLSVLRTVERMSSPRAARYGRLVGASPAAAAGPRPLRRGSTLPGFLVTELDAPHAIVLRGRHRFSDYQLTFRVDPVPTGTRITAKSRGVFPGLAGAAYRLLVIGTRFHVLTVRNMLRSMARGSGSARS